MYPYCVKNSKNVKPGYVFISILGLKTNGNNYIIEAANNGASKIIVQIDNPVNEEIASYLTTHNIPLEYVKDAYFTFANTIKQYYGSICNDITFIGVTGTKGKTTTCNALFNLFKANESSIALMSSAYHKINNSIEKAELTTEMVDVIYNFIEKAKKKGVTHIILEVSAHAFTQYRIHGILFDAFIFTNFSQDHFESYTTQDEYFLAKCELYNYLKPNAIVLVNKDDNAVLSSIKNIQDRSIKLKTFSSQLETQPDIYYNTQSNSIKSTKGILHYKKNIYFFNSSWLGIYNISNIACALLIIDELLILNQQKIIFLLKQVEHFENLPGRNEKYFLTKDRTVCIEKAYTPNSVESTLQLFQSLTENLMYYLVVEGKRAKKIDLSLQK